MFPSSSELHYFLELSNTLNFSRAAERLGISQPTLSLAIQRMEATLGATLFVRNKTGVQLTPSGRRLLKGSEELKQAWTRLRQDTLRDEKEIRGSYTLGCHPSVALYALPSFLAYFLENYPDLEIELVHDLSRKITEEVISFRVDFGIVVNPVPHPDLVIQEVCKDRVSLWTREGETELQKLDSPKSVLIYEPNLLQSQHILTEARKHFRRVVTSPNLDVIAAMVASGAGVGILPGRVATRIRSYGLRPVEGKLPFFQDRICLVYRANFQRTQARKLFARKLKEMLVPDAREY